MDVTSLRSSAKILCINYSSYYYTSTHAHDFSVQRDSATVKSLALYMHQPESIPATSVFWALPNVILEHRGWILRLTSDPVFQDHFLRDWETYEVWKIELRSFECKESKCLTHCIVTLAPRSLFISPPNLCCFLLTLKVKKKDNFIFKMFFIIFVCLIWGYSKPINKINR